jgi:CubicO group peptidase (beta-lactamase class C family)
LSFVLTSTLALVAGPAPVQAAPSRPPVVTEQVERRLRTADSLVASWVEAQRIPGALLLVSTGDDVLLERAYGSTRVHDYGGGQYRVAATGGARSQGIRPRTDASPVTRETVFDLASVTKVMATTFAVMLSVDRGELDLDAPVHTYLPDFRGGGKDAITIRHLLTHRAGLQPWKPIYYHATDADEAYAYIRDRPLAWDVGEGRHYSDLGFMLLGRVAERVVGMPLDAVLRDRLYGPLGLTATEFRPPTPGTRTLAATSHGNPYEHRMVHDSTFGYVYEGDPNSWDGWRRYTLVGEVNDGNAYHAFGGVAGHAGLFSTAEELQVLLQLLLDRGEYGGRRYLSAALVDSFLAPTGDGQALGWQTPDYAPPGSFAHTGFTGTFVLGVSPDALGVILLTNRQNTGLDGSGYYPDVGPLQRAVAAVLTGTVP